MCFLNIAQEEMFGYSLPFCLRKNVSTSTNGTARGLIKAPQTVYVRLYSEHCGCSKIAVQSFIFCCLVLCTDAATGFQSIWTIV